MKYLVIFLSIMILCSACKLNSQNRGFEEFNKEFSEESIKKIAQHSPCLFSEKVVSNYKHFAYYETFGNAGICVQFNTTKENEKQIDARIKNYELLKGGSISHQDSSYVYVYNERNLNIKIPELSEEFGDLSSVKLDDDKELDIYLIEKGKLSNVFINQKSNHVYNYSIGMYYFRKRSTFIYWFLVY
jgi:hypothetical protein